MSAYDDILVEFPEIHMLDPLDGWRIFTAPGRMHRSRHDWPVPWRRWSGRASRMEELFDMSLGPQPPDLSTLDREEKSEALRLWREAIAAWGARKRSVQVWGWTRAGCERKLREAVIEASRA